MSNNYKSILLLLFSICGMYLIVGAVIFEGIAFFVCVVAAIAALDIWIDN